MSRSWLLFLRSALLWLVKWMVYYDGLSSSTQFSHFSLLINSSHLLLISYLSIWVWPWNSLHVWKLHISVRNIHLSISSVVCHNDRIWSNGTISESNSTEFNIAEMAQAFLTLQIERVSLPKLQKNIFSHVYPVVCRHYIFAFTCSSFNDNLSMKLLPPPLYLLVLIA